MLKKGAKIGALNLSNALVDPIVVKRLLPDYLYRIIVFRSLYFTIRSLAC